MALLLVGCGGGSNDTSATLRPAVDINWGARTRQFAGPSSALSASVTFTGAAPGGGDVTYVVARPSTAGGLTTHVAPSLARAGATTISVTFYAGEQGQGAVVGRATTGAIVRTDGVLTHANGAPLGAIQTEATVKQVVVEPDQTVRVGETKAIVWSARDAEGNLVAVTPGSARIFAGSFLQVNPDGTVTGVRPDTVEVVVEVDQVSGRSTVAVLPAANAALQTLRLAPRRLAYVASSGRILATVGGEDVSYGNRLVEIDPATAQITRSVYVGSEPTAIAVSDDGQTAYVGLDGAAAVRKVSLSGFTANETIGLPTRESGPTRALDIDVRPGHAETIAVSLAEREWSGRFEGIVIFDSGQARPQQAQDGFDTAWIEWSDADTIIATSRNSREDLREFRLVPEGVELVRTANYGFNGNGAEPIIDGGRCILTDGKVIDLGSLGLLGTVPLAPAAPQITFVDAAGGRFYRLTTPTGMGVNGELYVYDLATYTLVEKRTVSGLSADMPSLATATGTRLVFASGSDVNILDLARLGG